MLNMYHQYSLHVLKYEPKLIIYTPNMNQLCAHTYKWSPSSSNQADQERWDKVLQKTVLQGLSLSHKWLLSLFNDQLETAFQFPSHSAW